MQFGPGILTARAGRRGGATKVIRVARYENPVAVEDHGQQVVVLPVRLAEPSQMGRVVMTSGASPLRKLLAQARVNQKTSFHRRGTTRRTRIFEPLGSAARTQRRRPRGRWACGKM